MSTNPHYLIEAHICISLTQPMATVSVSDSIYSLLGISANEFLFGKVTLQSRIHTHDQDIAAELFSTETNIDTNIDTNINSRVINFRLRHADGRIRCIKGVYRKINNGNSMILELLLQDAKSLWHPLSDQSTELSITTNFRAMMEHTDDYIYFKDRNHVFNGASQTLVEITESIQHRSEFLGLTDYDVFLEEYADIYYSLEKQVFAGINAAHDIQKILFKDGTSGWINNRKYPVKNEAGEILGLFGIAHDITENKKAEQALIDSEFRWKFAIEGSGDGVWDWNIQTNEVQYSTQWKEMLGYSDHEILPANEEWTNRICPDDSIYVAQTMQDYLADKIEAYIVRYRLRCKDNSYKWILGRGMIVSRSDDGKPLRMIGTHTDITKQKQLELQKEQYFKFFQLSTDPMCIADPYGCFQQVNPAFTSLLGFSESELLESPLIDFLLPEDREQTEAEFKSQIETRKSVDFENRYVCKDGTIKLLSWTAYFDKGDCVTYATAHDITLRRQAEQNLSIAATAFESQEGMMVTNAQSTILRVNKAFTDITGYAAEDVIGKTPNVLSSGHHDVVFYANMWDRISSTGYCEGEIWNKRKNGEIYPQHFTITSVINDQGLTTNYVGTMVDITDLKQHEQQRLINEATHRDTLVREVHHRIKNNLQGVSSLLSNFAEKHPDLVEPMNEAIGQVQSIAVTYGLQGRSAQMKVRLCELITDIVANHQSLWKISILVDIPEQWTPCLIIEVDAVPIALVLNELISNAVKHRAFATDINVTLRYQPLLNILEVAITNTGQLSASCDFPNIPIARTGLQLLKLLLPDDGASLSWEQCGDKVYTRLELSSPTIALEQKKEIEQHNES